jgi:protein-L-isoaspartate(D-aspartate) O-methyltransferase
MVVGLEARRAISSSEVRRAFLGVHREVFVPDTADRFGLAAVYDPDAALPVAVDSQGTPISSSSAPGVMAPMLEALRVLPGHRVLEIGSGSGYNSALLTTLVGPTGFVASVEIDDGLARSARAKLVAEGYHVGVEVGDGRLGLPSQAPFDRIVVTASSDFVPEAWRNQLVEGGLVEVPLRLGPGSSRQAVVTLRRDGPALRSTHVLPGFFMGLREASAGEPVVPTDPSLTASATGPHVRVLAALYGEPLSALSEAERRHLLALLLGPSRLILSLDPRDVRDLGMYLMVGEQPGIASCRFDSRFGTAIVGEQGTGAVAVTGGTDGVGVVEGWGDASAEETLKGAMDEWIDFGRPSLSDLMVSVTYEQAALAPAWRTIMCQQGVVQLRWAHHAAGAEHRDWPSAHVAPRLAGASGSDPP